MIEHFVKIKNLIWDDKEVKAFTLFGLALIFLLPLILKIPIGNWVGYFDYTNTGQIGDTIGGITGPFINLLGAILVYVAFKEQRESNILNEEKHKFDYIVQQIDKLENTIIGSDKLDIEKIKANIIHGTAKIEPFNIDTSDENIKYVLDASLPPEYYDNSYKLSNIDLAKIFLIQYMMISIINDFNILQSISDRQKSLFKRFINIYVLIENFGLNDIIEELEKVNKLHHSETKENENNIIELYSSFIDKAKSFAKTHKILSFF